MWDPDNFPGADSVPWQLLIRARFTHEIDAVLASVVVSRVGAVTSVDVARRLVDVARVKAGGEKAEPGVVLAAVRGLLEFDEWCGTGWPRRWPPRPKGHDFDDLMDPVAVLVMERAAELVSVAGSPDLQGGLGAALGELGGFGR
ncbi:hypothetical protein [Nocardioides rubriscoriae]|uniref:hypothetical protein n=1 Tax=Nocardioides rubriscoriae TaxID=642762 RepID=UPI0011DFB731|nr:hypothetical protein [Nocardioides rubriscoriae]